MTVAAPYDMLRFLDADDCDDELQVIEAAGADKQWVTVVEPFFPDATLLVLLFRDKGVRHIAVRYGHKVAEFDIYRLILRDGPPAGSYRDTPKDAQS